MILSSLLREYTSQNSDKSIPLDVVQILQKTCEMVPIGKSPIEELGLQWKNKTDYNQLKFILTKILQYPCADLAEVHRDSNRLGSYDLHENADIITKYTFEKQDEVVFVHCMCCGYMLQKDEIDLSASLVGIDNLGISTFLYFETLKSLGIMLLIQFFIYGIYSLVTNIIASGQFVNTHSIPSSLDFLVISLSSKQLNQSAQNQIFYLVQCWLGLATVIVWCIVLIIVKYYEKNSQIMVQSQTMSVADYSIMITGLPSKITHQQLQNNITQFYTNLREDQKPKQIDKPFLIKKINLVMPFFVTQQTFKDQELHKYTERLQSLRKMFIQWIQYRMTHDHFQIEQVSQRKAFYHTFISLKKKIERKRQRLVNQVVNEYKQKQFQKEEEMTSTAFVTMETNHAKQLISRLSGKSFLNRFRQFILCKSNETFKLKYGAQVIEPEIYRAPEPQDIIWTNLGQSSCERLLRKCLTYTITGVILAGSFGIIYLLSTQQTNNQQSYFISFTISIAISIINIIIQQVIRLLTSFQREQTQTAYQTSLAIKSVVAQLINTILTPFIVNYFIEKKNLYEANGLAYDLFLLGITNAFLMPILKIFDFYYFFLKIKAWWFQKPQNRLGLTQTQLNAHFQHMPFEIGYQYIYPVNLYLFVCYFISLQPILCLFAIFGLLLMFWAQKYSLLNRTKRPFPGNDFVNTAMYQMIYLGPLFFSLGNLTWSNLIDHGFPQSALIPNIISTAVSVLILFLPYKAVFIILFEGVYPEEMKFEEKRMYLPSQYDRLNPSTSKQAINEYVNYIKEVRDRIKSTTELQLQKIQQLFLSTTQQGRRKQPQLFSLLNYYTNLSKIIDEPKTPSHAQRTQMTEQFEFQQVSKEKIKEKEEEEKEQDQQKIGLLDLLGASKNHHVVNFVQNWTKEASNSPHEQIKPEQQEDFTYLIFSNLVKEIDEENKKRRKVVKNGHKMDNRSMAHQMTLNKFQNSNNNPVTILGPSFLRKPRKSNRIIDLPKITKVNVHKVESKLHEEEDEDK